MVDIHATCLQAARQPGSFVVMPDLIRHPERFLYVDWIPAFAGMTGIELENSPPPELLCGYQ